MNPDCIAEIARAIGQTPTSTAAAGFERDILDTMRRLAKSEPNWRSMTGDDRLRLAAKTAHDDAIAAADNAARRRISNATVQLRESKRLAVRAAEIGGNHGHHKAVFERLGNVDDFVAGLRGEAMGDLVDTMSAMHPGFLGLIEDPANIRDFVRAVRGEGKPTPEMAKAAKAYIDTLEKSRLRANAAGADIGKLDYSYLPQPHDTGRIARAEADTWSTDVLPLLDRDRYVEADGSRMDDAAVTDFLKAAWTTLATEGRNKLVPGAGGKGSRASRFDDAHRAIHFKDADSHLAYLSKYGRGGMLESIHGHVGQMAKTIGLLEELGANPNATMRLLKDLAEKGDNVAGVHSGGVTLDMVWNTLNGTTSQPVSIKLAQFFQGIRNFTSAVRLQSVMLSAITDAPLQVIVAKANGVPLGKAVGTLFNGVGKEKANIARSLGLAADEVAGEMARWHSDNMAQGWTRKLADATMKLTLINAWSNALRRGFTLTLSETLARQVQTPWARLGAGDLARLKAGGVTARDWELWAHAKPYDLHGANLLTKDGLRGLTPADLQRIGATPKEIDTATARLLGFLDQEGHTAVLTPDLRTRALVQGGTTAGTVPGEIIRSAMLFKSFAFAIVSKHVARIRHLPTAQGKLAYSVAMMGALPLFGAMSLQLKDLFAGKDPRDMTTGKFWLAAAAQGGGLGVFGDLLYTSIGGNSRAGTPNYTSLAGPVFGNAIDLLDLTIGNAAKYAKGKKTQFGADAIRFAKSNTPFINLFYLRAALDHLLIHDLQEQVSPGYLRKMRQQAHDGWGQDFWWRPGDKLPERAPELRAAAGGR